MSLNVRRVLLVGWPGADWKLVHPLLDAGLMPNLRDLVERGSMGSVATLEPRISSVLWTSAATGMTPDRHGIVGPLEPDPVTGGVRPASSLSRKVKALWNVLHQSGRRSLVVNWPAGGPAEPIRGACVSPSWRTPTAAVGALWDVAPDSVYPADLAATLAALRVHPGDLTGDDLLPFLPQLARIDQERDPRPTSLAAILAEDITAHGAATWLMENREWDFAAVSYDSLDRAARLFLPYHPPRMADVEPDEFEIYKDVVNGVYSFHDLMLGRLVQLAGPDAAIVLVSDHGFLTGDRRPSAIAGSPAERPQGILCMAGPGIAADELLYGATLLDIAPTVLALFGLPAGEDMTGRVLAEAFVETASLERIPSWENVAGDCGMHPVEPQAATGCADSVRQLAALGYVDSAGEAAAAPLRQCLDRNAMNLGRVYLGLGRPADALPLFERLRRERSGIPDLNIHLAQCYYELGRLEECRRVAGELLARNPEMPAARVIQANLCLVEGDTAGALDRLLAAGQSSAVEQPVLCMIGRVYLALARWPEAEGAFRKLLQLDTEDPQANSGLAQALLNQGEWEQAAAAAAEALAFRFDLPDAHYSLGVALARLGRVDRAIAAFHACLKLRPDLETAHAWLARLEPEYAAAR